MSTMKRLKSCYVIVFLVMCSPFLLYAQPAGKLNGTVTDAETGNPLPGANVVVQGTELGASADQEGGYVN